MRFKIAPVNFLLNIVIIVLICIGFHIVYGAILLEEQYKNIMTDPSQKMYIYDLSDEFNLKNSSNDKVYISTSDNYSDVFVIENVGYTFSNSENYEIYKKMTSPLSMFALSSIGNKNIDYVELFNAVIEEKTWEDIGVFDDSLKGKIQIKIIYNNDKELEIIKEYLKQIYPNNYEDLISKCYMGQEFKSNLIHIGFKFAFPQKIEIKEVSTNLPIIEAQCILYKTMDKQYKDFHVNEIYGFEFVEKFENNNAINVWKGSEKLSVNIEKIVEEPVTPIEESTNISNEEIANDEDALKTELEEIFENSAIKTMTYMLIFLTILLFISMGLKIFLMRY